MNIYDTVTDQIVAQLEQGTAPWVKPWQRGSTLLPTNALTRKAYRGINMLILLMETERRYYERSQWMTYKQAASVGGQVRKGARGVPIVFYQFLEEREEGESKRLRQAILRIYTVFNVADIADLPGEFIPAHQVDPCWDPSAKAESLLSMSGARIVHGGNWAYYHTQDDRIQLPARQVFDSRGAYYATALHELVHWSGHPSRCDRQFGKRFADDSYAAEELVAELGAAFLCSHCQIAGQLQHANYIAEWLRIMKADKRAVFHAAAKAQQASDFVIRLAERSESQDIAA